ncbi:MAG: toll/interleukin-1 receptor domain-containing protein [Phototrophicaceae bacterium]
MSHIFISYSRKDREHSEKLELLLQERNFEVWRDDQIPVGSGWENEILQNIKNCEILVVLMSVHSVYSQWVMKEIEHAQKLNKHIIPILLSGKAFPNLASIQHVDMTTDVHISPQLTARIKTLLAKDQSDKQQIGSLNYYVEELENALSSIVNQPIISDILDYRNKKAILKESIEAQLSPEIAPMDIHQKDEILNILSNWQELAITLQGYSDEITEITEETLEQVEDLVEEWDSVLEKNPDAEILPPFPPKNEPSQYNSDLFGNEPE